MTITFFKNESDFYPRISYVWENAYKVSPTIKLKKLKEFFRLISGIPCLLFALYNVRSISNSPVEFIAIVLLILPVHELCHAIFCWVNGRKIERICFFPYKTSFHNVGAYVMPAFGCWTKIQSILFCIFPIILLTIIPWIISFFTPVIQFELKYLSLLNIGISSFDIYNALSHASLPKKSIIFNDLTIIQIKEELPIIIHQISISPPLKKVCHRQYYYHNGKLTKVPSTETNDTKKLKQEFFEQFNLNPTSNNQ